MTKQQTSIGMALYLLLVRIDPKDQAGKMGHKNMSKDLKKQLAIEGNNNSKEYMQLLNASESITDTAKAGFERDELRINPGAMIQFIAWRYPELMKPYRLKHMHMMKLKDAYQDGLVWNSVRVSNKIVAQIEIYIKENYAK